LRCICGGSGVVLMNVDHAQQARLAILDRYGDRALTPCDCTDGRARAAKWRNLPREANGLSLAAFRPLPAQKAAVKQALAFVADPSGWLTLIGGYGIGKTRIIYACMNDLAARGIVGRYVMMPELLNELRSALRDDDYGERLRRFVEAPLLAVDELDKIRDSDFVDEVLQAIFLARYQERETLSTIIGYNADGAERIPPFLRSRIRDSRFRLVEMAGPDLRPIAGTLDPWDRGEGEP
jgi:DNA replication protein DnaC